MEKEGAPTTIDEYLAGFEGETLARLKRLRKLIAEKAPGATEKISYQMPTFFLNGNLIHFAAFKEHIGLYPTPSGIVAFDAELVPYKRAKGSIRLPLDEPMPWDLIVKIVEFRVAENLKKPKKK